MREKKRLKDLKVKIDFWKSQGYRVSELEWLYHQVGGTQRKKISYGLGLSILVILIVLMMMFFSGMIPNILMNDGDSTNEVSSNNDDNSLPVVENVKIKGSSTVLPIAITCAEEFMNMNSDVQITVAGGGSSVGIKSVANGEVDIGDASRGAKASDVEDIDGVELSDLVDNVVAYDGIAVVVSPNVKDNGVTALTMDEIYRIYMGNISNWNEVGGPDLEIYVNDRASTSGTRATFVELIENSEGNALEDFEEDGGNLAVDNVNQENANVVTAVSGSQQAIGYVGLGYVNEDTCPAVSVDGVMPSTITVKDGSYPISRSLHMYTLGTPTGLTKEFIDYVQSEDGQEVIAEEGFITI